MFETLRGKILAIASVALIGTLVLGGVAIHATRSGADRLEVVYRQAVAPLTLIQTIERDVKEVRFRLAGVLLHQLPTMGSSVHLKGVMASLPVQWKEFHDLAAAQPLDEEGRARLEKISAGMDRLQLLMADVLKAYESDSLTSLGDLLENQWPRVHGQVVKPLEQFIPIYEEQAKVSFESALVASERLVWLVVALAACVLLIVAGAYGILQRSISRQFDLAKQTVAAISRFDLSQPVVVSGKDEVSHLLQELGEMQTGLRDTVKHVREASDRVGTASNEINLGNQNLSSRTEQAASSLEQTAASMEELNCTVHNSADAAKEANELASRASEIAVRGGNVVGQVVSTMEEINLGSRKISDIIGVIDGIAFQTNILALNAAVEAARAGEQGRGFAVVASEVRNLAQRSAEAAKEIKNLIGASVEHVEVGTRLVDEAGQTMGEIVSSIKRVTDIVSEISRAANEESDGIGQINTAVVHLDQMTQQNASLVEESAALAQNLQEEAHHLAQLVAVFRIDGAGDRLASRA